MAELPVPPPTETSPTPESSASRIDVAHAVNDASFTWQGRIDQLHKAINPFVEIDKLANTTMDSTPGQKREITDQDRREFADYRTFEQGVRGMNGYERPHIFDDQESDYVRFILRDPSTGQVEHRREGLDISELINSEKREVEHIKARLDKYPNSTYDQKRLGEHAERVKLLEKSSIPYEEAFPAAFDETNPMSLDKLRQEAKIISEDPHSRSRNENKDEAAKENWEAAKQRLHDARLLKIPPKPSAEPKTAPAVMPSTPVEIPKELPTEEPIPMEIGNRDEPFATMFRTNWPSETGRPWPVKTDSEPPEPMEIGDRNEPEKPYTPITPGLHSGWSSKPYTQDDYPEPITHPLPYEDRTSSSAPTLGSAPIPGYRTPEQAYFPPKAVPETKLNAYEEIIDTKSVLDAQTPAEVITGYSAMVRNVVKGIKESGTTKITDIVDKIKTLKDETKGELAKLDPKIAKRVEALSKIKTPKERKTRIAALLFLLAVAVCNLRDTSGNYNAPEMPQTTISESGPGAPFPKFDELKPSIQLPTADQRTTTNLEQAPIRQPKSIEEFRNGVGLEGVKLTTADYTIREDHRQRLDVDGPRNEDGSRARNPLGYSVEGMVKADIARLINEELGKEATALEAGGQPLPESSHKLNRTLELLSDGMDDYYLSKGWYVEPGGLYSDLVHDFTARMKLAISRNNDNLGVSFGNAVMVNDHIKEGVFKKWEIGPKDMDEWFSLWLERQGNTSDPNPSRWKEFGSQIIRQIEKEAKP